MPITEVQRGVPAKQMAANLRGNPEESLSQYLLHWLVLRKIDSKKPICSEGCALIAHIAQLTVVSEERIISKGSLFCQGATTAPLERAVFSFFLTGMDDADSQPLRSQRQESQAGYREDVVQSILDKKKATLSLRWKRDGRRCASRENRTSVIEATAIISATQDNRCL